MFGGLLFLAHLSLAPLAVVSEPSDPLRPIAEEIAREAGVAVQDSWSDSRAEYLVWVVEPRRMADRRMIGLALAWRDRFPQTAVGLISGSTAEHARALWRRGREAHADRSSAFDASKPLTRQRFVEALAGGGYVTFAGHGGERYLQLSQSTQLRAGDLPPLANLVVGTASCNVLRPWAKDSIALVFVEKGAAAFAGFVYSPEAGFLMDGSEGLPFRYTSPDFPIGRVVHLQNRGAMRAFAALPVYFLLGDPRISLAAQPPYRVVADATEGERRSVVLADAPRGLLPVRIRGGAVYGLTEASGTAAVEGHGFYNSRLQALDSGSDKFVLVDHAGGPLVIRLERKAP